MEETFVWFHGFGEQHIPHVLDVGTNFLVAWSFQAALLGDFYGARTQWAVNHVRFATNAGR